MVEWGQWGGSNPNYSHSVDVLLPGPRRYRGSVRSLTRHESGCRRYNWNRTGQNEALIADDDGIPDEVEAGGGDDPVDTDGDGSDDYVDTDSDGDGISDSDEGAG